VKIKESITHLLIPQVIPGYKISFFILLLGSFLITSKMGLLLQPRSLYLIDLGMSLSLYGLLLGIGWGLMFFFQSAAGRFSDILKNRKTIVLYVLVLDILFLSVFLATKSIVPLAIVFVIEVILQSIVFQLMLVMLSDVVDSDSYGAGYGIYKAFGSLGWAICAAFSGFIFMALGFKVLVIGAIIAQLLIFLLFYKFKEPPFHSEKQELVNNPDKFELREIISWPFLAVCFLYLFIMFQNKAGITYFYVYMTKNMLVTAAFAGIVIAVAGLIEIPLTLFGGKIYDRFHPRALLIWGCLIGSLRWVILPYIQNPYLLFLLQIPQAIIITVIFVGFPSYTAKISKPNLRGTMFGILGSISSIGAIAGPVVIGRLGEILGLRSAIQINGGFGVTGVIIFILILFISQFHSAKIHKRQKDSVCCTHS
jgi:MFS family permease